MDAKMSRPRSLGELGGWLRRRREELGLTLDDLAGKTGISKPYLSNIETARAPGPPLEEKLRRVAGALGLDEGELAAAGDWLRTPESVRRMVAGEWMRRKDGTIDLDAGFGGEADGGRKHVGHAQRGPYPAGHGTPKSDAYAAGLRPRQSAASWEGPLPVREVPVINKVAAGKASEFGDMNYPAGVADEYVPAPDLPGASVKSAFALKVSGDSMMPEYAEGEIIIVGPGEAMDGDDCVVRLGEGENFATTFKRVFFVRDAGMGGGGEVTGVRMVALNPKYAERVVRLEEVSGVYPLMYRMLPAKRGVRDERGKGEEVREITQRVSIEHD